MKPKIILLIKHKKEEQFLRTRTVPFDFSKFEKKTIEETVKKMREIMKKANGIGLSANQVGIPYRFFVAQVPDTQGKQKFYAIFNPEITKVSKDEVETVEEGCLSVPDTYGLVERAYRLILGGQDKRGKKIKIKAWGLLARVFQHEVDHLDGKLFIDKAKETHVIES